MSKQEIIIGNSLDELKKLPAESIDVVVTSPPYWALRDYKSAPVVWGGDADCDHEWEDHTEPARGGVGATANVGANKDGEGNNRGHPTVSQYCAKCRAWRGQLGLEPSPLEYIDHLMMIFDEVKRVLKPTGACWVNIGDTYSTFSNAGPHGNLDNPKSAEGLETGNLLKKNIAQYGFPSKTLIQIPSRFAIAMTDRGWILRNEIIWHKANCMPVSVKDRFTVDFEKFYFFTKEPKYYFNQIKEPMSRPNDVARFGGQKKGNNNNTYSSNKYDASSLNGMRNARTVWKINTQPSSDDHCAMFPKTLVERPIKACCPAGGTVLDPFAGSGTVLEYCFDNDINGIGIEINPDFKRIIERRMHKNQGRLTDFLSDETTEEIA